MDDLDGLESLPSLRRFVVELSSYLSSTYPPNTIFIQAPRNEQLVESLVASLVAKLAPTTSTPPPATPPTIQDLLPNHVRVNLRQVHSTRATFDIILNTLSGWSDESNPPAWSESSGKVANWEGRSDGYEVVQVKSKKRSLPVKKDLKGKKKARRQERMDEEEEDDELMIQLPVREEPEEEEVTEDVDEEEEESTSWSISWDPSSEGATKNPVGPLRDTFDYLHQNLEIILSLGEEEVRRRGQAPPRRRRWIIFEHGEMLAELAPPGNIGGAPRETGMGMTFTSAIHRIGELVSTSLLSFLSRLLN